MLGSKLTVRRRKKGGPERRLGGRGRLAVNGGIGSSSIVVNGRLLRTLQPIIVISVVRGERQRGAGQLSSVEGLGLLLLRGAVGSTVAALTIAIAMRGRGPLSMSNLP